MGSGITVSVLNYGIYKKDVGMSDYRAPLEEIVFALKVAQDARSSATASARQETTQESTHDDVLGAAATLAEDVLAPLNAAGDREGSWLEGKTVRTPNGLRRAYSLLAEGGWQGLGVPSRLGGQGVPFSIAMAVSEMLNSANLALAMGLMPTPGVVDLIERFGTARQKEYYIPRLVSGSWTATMALTESQAGSDLGAVRSQARLDEAGEYVLRGRKSFITWGDHDLSDSILHLVLARSPAGLPGSKGLSLYLVPKHRSDGQLNDVECVGLERKIGLRASPTASLVFGENSGAIGELLGHENAGLSQLFFLLNQARLRVAGFALGSAERARQAALAYAAIRVQGRDPSGCSVTIDKHPDVQRMLLSMDALTEAMRLLISYAAGFADDVSEANDAVSASAELLEVLTPIVKGWSTETGFIVASTGVQIFGGMGYSSDCEASQYFCEARVNMIYEGTTGIQANDLIFRKMRKDGGRVAEQLLLSIEGMLTSFPSQGPDDDAIRVLIEARLHLLRTISNRIVRETGDMTETRANAAHYLVFFGAVLASWLSWAAACRAKSVFGQDEIVARKIGHARFMAEQCLAPAAALAESTLLRHAHCAGGDA